MAQAVHPRFPIKGDEGQQTEEDDQRSFEAMRNEGEEFGQFGGNVIDGREAFHDGHVPGACAAGSGQEHTDAGRGKDIQRIADAERTELLETGDEQPELQEIAHPDGGAQTPESPRPFKASDGRNALPEIAQEHFHAAQSREGETNEQTNHASRYYIYGVAWGGGGESAREAREQADRVLPAQQDGGGNDENETAHVGQFLDDHGTEGLGRIFHPPSAHHHTAHQFAQTRSDTVDEVGNEDEFDGAPTADAQPSPAQEHTPAQRAEYVGNHPSKQCQGNPYVVGPLGKHLRERAKVETAIQPHHQPHPKEGENYGTEDSLKWFGHGI